MLVYKPNQSIENFEISIVILLDIDMVFLLYVFDYEFVKLKRMKNFLNKLDKDVEMLMMIVGLD